MLLKKSLDLLMLLLHPANIQDLSFEMSANCVCVRNMSFSLRRCLRCFVNQLALSKYDRSIMMPCFYYDALLTCALWHALPGKQTHVAGSLHCLTLVSVNACCHLW